VWRVFSLDNKKDRRDICDSIDKILGINEWYVKNKIKPTLAAPIKRSCWE
jgi:hypothetical protein